ncbi:MAG: site-specific DNA-methyltransferase [Candidatus Korobacteraceae bacterium]
MPRDRATKPAKAKTKTAKPYKHPEADNPMRPEVGTQAQFKKKLPPKTYKYDSSLSPAMEWDGQNPAREQGEALVGQVLEAESLEQAKAAASKLKAISKPFLNWAGKAERLSFDVPSLPLFIHERLSTKAILETLKGHKKQGELFDLFADPQHSIADQVLRAYEHRDKWVNRMILGDSLVVMNSLLQYEGMGGQVQMIYIDPPYGVRFGSNFQPFIRKRDVSHNDDEDMTREPEMIQAYRDTWELGLHSYLTYLRDRLLLARELLTPSGSVFVQISDENIHHLRELMDEVFGSEQFVSLIAYTTSGGFTSKTLSRAGDYLLWYCRDHGRIKYHESFKAKPSPIGEADSKYDQLELEDGTRRALTQDEKNGQEPLPLKSRVFRVDNLISAGFRQNTTVEFAFQGESYHPGMNNNWKASIPDGMNRLADANRIIVTGKGKLGYLRYYDDFPVVSITNMWSDIGGAVQSRSDPKIYVVQTGRSLVERCALMTSDPGDLVLDPTCGSGTTAYVAEQWGRRWITIDTSRVPLALARQRLLTATYDWYELKDELRGPASGFVYKRKQNKSGEEIGGIVPHVTLKSIANNEPPDEEVLVDRPEIQNGITRVTGAFCVEGTIPTPMDWHEVESKSDAPLEAAANESFIDRMLEVLRKSPMLRLGGNKTVTLKNIRPPAKSLSLSAEAMVDATAPGQKPTLSDAVQEAEEKSGLALPLSAKPVAFVFGPENGAVSERLVSEAAREANAKNYTHLYVLGFAVQPNARQLVENCELVYGLPATYVQATPDLMMGDLLKNMRSSQIFSVCGLPEVAIHKHKNGGAQQYAVELLGLDVFNPATTENEHRSGDDVPAWFLDTDYNGMCFHVSQAFFPRTSAWDNLKKSLAGEYDDSVWEHLAGTTSAPFEGGEHGQVAVKVIDDRGNELLVVKKLSEAK